MAEEILNIEHNIKHLIVKALQRFPRVVDAAKALGIHRDTLYKKNKQYSIVHDPLTRETYLSNKKR